MCTLRKLGGGKDQIGYIFNLALTEAQSRAMHLKFCHLEISAFSVS